MRAPKPAAGTSAKYRLKEVARSEARHYRLRLPAVASWVAVTRSNPALRWVSRRPRRGAGSQEGRQAGAPISWMTATERVLQLIMKLRDSIRPAAVAGSFYPAEPGALARDVSLMLAAAEQPESAPAAPKAIIAPHAGYVYSGPVAAQAYAVLRSARDRIRRVVLLGPCHRVPVRGLAVPTVEAFASPLGSVAIDRRAIALVADLPQVVVSDNAHAHEHSLEVHLPFLQSVLQEFEMVPFAVGRASPEEVAEVLDRLWGGDETLIVVSSDLSHYLPYAVAQQMDRETVNAILRLDVAIDHEQACGGTPVNGLLLAARRRRLRARLLDLRNSGDTAGDRNRVVGYCSIAFEESV